MDILTGVLSNQSFPVVATIGFFDGVHKGHQYLLQQVTETARKHHLHSMVITFKNHPKQILCPDSQPALITSFEERLHLIAGCGIDYCYLLDFTHEMANMTATNFMNVYLKDLLNVKILFIGYDHHFGSDPAMTFENYKECGSLLGITVLQASKFDSGTYQNISSSAIRSLIQTGQIEQANCLTGHPYTLSGKIVAGRQLGRKLGFPTANIRIISDKILPREGVYAVRASVNGKSFTGVANWGKRPTVDSAGQMFLEVHLLDFNTDIYDEQIEVSFMKYLRTEKHFRSLEELANAMQKDIAATRLYFNNLCTIQ